MQRHGFYISTFLRIHFTNGNTNKIISVPLHVNTIDLCYSHKTVHNTRKSYYNNKPCADVSYKNTQKKKKFATNFFVYILLL